jgi:hypothetical protein
MAYDIGTQTAVYPRSIEGGGLNGIRHAELQRCKVGAAPQKCMGRISAVDGGRIKRASRQGQKSPACNDRLGVTISVLKRPDSDAARLHYAAGVHLGEPRHFHRVQIANVLHLLTHQFRAAELRL